MSPEKGSIFYGVTVTVILSKNLYVHMNLILDSFWDLLNSSTGAQCTLYDVQSSKTQRPYKSC
jgi:hypothetical protein